MRLALFAVFHCVTKYLALYTIRNFGVVFNRF